MKMQQGIKNKGSDPNSDSLERAAASESARNVVIYALSMAFGTMTSRVLGLVRDMVFTALFSRTVTDAWTTAFRLPNMFRRLLGEGALSVSFIPVFVESRIHDPSGVRSRNLVNGLYTLLLITLMVITTLGTVFTEPILNLLLDSHYSDIPGKFELTLRMSRIMFSFVFMISSYAFFMGILNALGRYALAAIAPTLWNITMIASTFVPIAWLSSPGDAIAWGVVIGGALQAGLLIPSLYKAGYFPHLKSDLKACVLNPDVLKIFRNMLPGLLGLGLLQITTIVNLRFASELGEGPISYIYLADRLLELPLSLVSVSLGTALLPTLSAMWARKEQERMIETANYYLRLNLFVAVPAAIGLYVLSIPIIELLFQRGHFLAADAQATASVLRVYAFILLSSSCVRVLVPGFYAVKNTWLPAVVSGICLTVHIIVAPLLMGRFGLQGLVGSSFVSASLNMTLLLAAYRMMIGPFGFVKLLVSFLKFIVAGAGLWWALQFYDEIHGVIGFGRFGLLISVFATIGVGGMIYAGLAWLLRCEELVETMGTVVSKLTRRLKSLIKPSQLKK
jgi:putative peptidoglycan lipid II flippase